MLVSTPSVSASNSLPSHSDGFKHWRRPFPVAKPVLIELFGEVTSCVVADRPCRANEVGDALGEEGLRKYSGQSRRGKITTRWQHTRLAGVCENQFGSAIHTIEVVRGECIIL